MNKTVLASVTAALLVAVLFGGWFVWKMDVLGEEIGLSARYDAQANVVETKLFEMRSAIKNIHSCTEEWADKFIKAVAMQAFGRGGNKATLPAGNEGVVAAAAVASSGTSLQIGRESEALGIPQEVYLKLANAIEGKLADFTRQQVLQNDIWREHRTYCQDPWHNQLGVHLIGKVKPMPEMITSTEAKDAVKNKKMDEKLF
jgi:hypothetical protein